MNDDRKYYRKFIYGRYLPPVDLPIDQLRNTPVAFQVSLIAQLARLVYCRWAWDFISERTTQLWQTGVSYVERLAVTGKLPKNSSKVAEELLDVVEDYARHAKFIADLATAGHERPNDPQRYLAASKLVLSSYCIGTILKSYSDEHALCYTCSVILSTISDEDSDDSFRAEAQRLAAVVISSVDSRLEQSLLVPPGLFAFTTVFEKEIRDSGLISVVPTITEELIARLRENPKYMLDLHPREFEELIARLFEGFGFRVELTLPTRDQGRDIIAIDNEDTRKYLIECKRFRDTKVDIAIVQRLNGVVHAEGATKGIIATTSTFTGPALEYLKRESVKWRLEGKDFQGLRVWLEKYHKDRLSMVDKGPYGGGDGNSSER